MAQVYKDIIRLTIDLKTGVKEVVAPIKQADNLSRVLRCQLINNGKPINLKGSQLLLYVVKADYKQCVINGVINESKTGVVDFELTEQSLILAEEIQCEIVKIDEGDVLLSFPIFKIGIDGALYDNELVESTNEFSALTALISNVANWENRFVKECERIEEKFDGKIDEVNTQLSEIANKGTTVEVLERVTKEEINRQISDGTIANMTILDDSITAEKIKKDELSSEEISSLKLDKIYDIDKLGLPFSKTKEVINNSIYTNSKNINSDFTAKTDGYLVISNYHNESSDMIELKININGTNYIVSRLLPQEKINFEVKECKYDSIDFDSLIFDGNVILTDNGGEFARITTSVNIGDIYSKNVASANIYSESIKYVGKPQTDFETYEGNLIGIHQSGAVHLKVSKSDVVNSGFSFDANGVANYVKNIQNFKIHLKLIESRKESFHQTIPIKTNDVVRLNGVDYVFYSKYNYNDEVIKTYVAQAENTLKDKSFENVIVKINANLTKEEASNCVVLDEEGTIIKSQKIRNVGARYGEYGDGYSLILIDTYQSAQTKTYKLEIYNNPKELSSAFNVDYSNQYIKITNENNDYFLDRSKNNLFSKVMIDGVNVNSSTDNAIFRFTHNDSVSNKELFEVGELMSFDIESGCIMCKVATKIKYNNIIHEIMYEFYTNGEVRIINFNKAMIDTTCSSLLMRVNLEFEDTPTYLYKNPCSFHTDNQAMCVAYSNGDIPRDEGYGYPTFKVKAMGQRIEETKLYSLICGYENEADTTTYTIPKDFLFTNCIIVDFKGSYLTGIYTFNQIVGSIIDNNIVKNKYIIKDEIVRHIRNINEDIEKIATSTQEKLVPSMFARLVLAKEYGMFSIDEISKDFKTLMTHDYRADASGVINVENMLAQYEEGRQSMQFNSRVFPLAKYLLKEFKKLDKQDEVKFYEDTIKTYAEMVCRVFEKYGNTPLTGSSAVNANSTASGCLALSNGLEIEENQRWLDALNKNHEILKSYMFLNILQEGNDVSSNHFLHYHCYASHDYYSCEMISEKLIHPSQYAFSCLNAQFEPLEELYCCSRSRRGLGSTVGYIIYLLTVTNTPLSLDVCRKLLENLWCQSRLTGGQNYPLYNYEEFPPQVLETSTPIELQALTDVYFLLLNDNFKNIL